MLCQYHYLLSSSPIPRLHSFSKLLSLRSLTLTLTLAPPHPHPYSYSTTSIINLKKPHINAFAGNPITSKTSNPFSSSPTSALQTLKTTLLLGQSSYSPNFKILPFSKGRPLAGSSSAPAPNWHLGWLSLADCKILLLGGDSEVTEDSFVYLGGSKSEHNNDDDVGYWAIDVSDACNNSLVNKLLGSRQLCFLELRTLMVAADWSDPRAMADLAIAGHARALLEWHKTSQFCGRCGEKTIPMEAGTRNKCSNESCKKTVYPRVDPVVIMLVIDKENDRALLSRQSRYVPRMWSCLAGFIEPGESLEEAVRRETWEETRIEVDEVIYHSSQPWPVGSSSMPCQLMVGFFAYAKSLEINVDHEELEDAKWHTREDVKKALSMMEYKKAQITAANKVEQMCKGVKKEESLSADFNMESGELAPMFIPGPYAIAHHLISSWAGRSGP